MFLKSHQLFFKIIKLFSGLCVLFNLKLSRFVCFAVRSSLAIISNSFHLVNNFLSYFWESFKLLLFWNNFDILSYRCYLVKNIFQTSLTRSGEGGIWTLAPVARPTPLAGAPLRPLEYFSSFAFAMPRHYTRITLILSITFLKFFNTFLLNQ